MALGGAALWILINFCRLFPSQQVNLWINLVIENVSDFSMKDSLWIFLVDVCGISIYHLYIITIYIYIYRITDH